MVNKEFEFKLKIDAEINSLLQKLESIKTSLGNLNNAGKMPNLEKNFGSITKNLTKLQERIAQPITSTSTFTSTQKELASLKVAFSNLNKTIENLQQLSREEKLTLIDEATLKNLEAANSAIANFQSAWERSLASNDAAKQLKEKYDAAKKLNEAAEKKLQAKRQEYELRKQGIADEKARREEESKTAKEAVENLKQRQELLQRLQKARKDLASASSEQNDASENYRKLKEVSSSKKKAFDEATSTRDTTSSRLEVLKSWKATEAKYEHMDESGKKPDKRAAEYQRSKKSAKAIGIDISTPEKLDAAIAQLTETLKSQNSAVVESSRAYNAAEKERKKYADRVEKLVAVEGGVAGSFDKTTGALNTSKVRKYGQEVDELTNELKDLDPALEGLSDDELKKVLEDTTDSLSQQKKAVKEASASYEKAAKAEEDFQNDIKSLTETTENSRVAFENAKKAMSEAEESASAEAYKALVEQLKKCGDEFQDLPLEYTEDNFEAIKKIVEELENNALAKVDKTLVKLRGQFDATGKIIQDTEKKTADLREEYESFTKANAEQEAFENKIKQFLGMAGAAQVLRSALRNAMQTIKELDATMTEMATVTDLSVGDYWDQLPEYSQRASELGVSINSAYKAATLYYQQGLKVNEVSAISAETLKMAKIAGLDAANATNKMTAALRGFNMELNETSAQRVSDVYSELAAITAADTKEIANAMTKTASIASSAGMEFETTAAFLSQIIETTRESAETAGTAMKTVIARFQELKKDPSEIGEVDGEIVDANKIETALRSVGVTLRDTNGQFRDLDDVFLELSSKWDGLDKNTQRYIATIAAGSRQQSRFLAMMSDYARTQELVTAANTSAGASQRQFEKTLEGVEAKLAKLKNAWDEFTMGIMNSELVKNGINILTKFLEIINKSTSALDGIGGSLVKIAGVLAVFKLGQSLFAKLKQPILDFAREIVVQMGITGEKSGKAFIEGCEKAKQEYTQQKKTDNQKDKTNKQDKETKGDQPAGLPEGYSIDRNGRVHHKGKFVTKEEEEEILSQVNKETEKPSVKQQIKEKALDTVKEKSGFNKVSSGIKDLGIINKKRKTEANLEKLQQKKKEVEERVSAGEEGAGKKLEVIDKKINEAKQSLKEFGDDQKKIEEQGKTAWKNIGEGISQAGAAMTGLGVSISVVGGILSSLGLEEVGETFSIIGNYVIIAGTAFSALGPIISTVGSIATATGLTASAAWGWMLLIAAGVAAVVATVVLVANQLDKINPEKKLQRAQAAAEEAEKGAQKAAEAYKTLADSIDSLDNKYDSLKDMTKGTQEWNNAVQDVNSSVLELLEEYSELSGLVKNEGGVLTLDVDSAEVQDILQAYKKDELVAKGSSMGAKAELAKAKTEYSLDKMDDDVFEKFQTDGQSEAVLTAIGNAAASTAAGIAAGAAIGAGTGAVIGAKAGTVTGTVAGAAAGGVGAAPGAAVGAGAGALAGAGAGAVVGGAIGGATGLFAGIVSMQYTIDQVEKHNEQNRKNVKELAQAYANGETGETVQEIAQYIERNGLAAGKAAEQMAQSLLEESETMREFGESLNSLNEQEQAIYSAMALNAQQMLDLSSFTQAQMDQMNTVFDDKLMKSFEESEKERLKTEAADKDGNFEKEKEDFAKVVYGNNARVKGNKIVDEKGETIREFENEEAWINEIAAANATKEAAEAMKEIPGVINKTLQNFESGMKTIFEKALEGKSLTRGELRNFEEGLGQVTYKDEDGNVAKTWDQLDPADQDIWGSEKAYLKSLDKDYSGIDSMWEDLTLEQKKAFGWNGDSTDTESLEKAKEAYEATFTKISEKQSEAFEKAEKAATNMGIMLSDQLSAEAAQSWALGLENAAPGTTGNEIYDVNKALSEVLKGLSFEEVENVMAEINSMDKMDVESWNRLGEVFEELDIDAPAEALKNLATSGIKAFNAIEKIDFNTLSEDINNIYKTIGKAQQGNRVYSEADYKEFIAANKNLEDSFTKIGDDFIYIGGSMEELTQALEKNTIAKLGEANRQLKTRGAMAEIITQETDDKKYSAVENMGQLDLMTYITNMRQAFADQNLDIADLGIEGLSNSTDVSKISEDKLRKWAQVIVQEGGKSSLYKEEYKKGVQEANVQRYLQNDATYNAEQAAQEDEYSAQHQEALIIQAIQSGGVSNDLIEQYKEAIEKGNNTQAIKDLGEKIANATEKIVKASEGRDSYKDLVDRVAVALQEASQKEIDKLSELNDSINSANQRMIDKIQEQINYQREQDAIDEAQKDLDNMYAQQAYLARDTSGGSFLEAQALEADIANAEKEMENTLIDQALQRLADENERLVQQGEQQISLLQDQLNYSIESGEIAEEAGRLVSESIDKLKTGTLLDDTEMYRVLFGAEGKNLSGLAAEDWSSHLRTTVTSAQNYNDSIGKSSDKKNVTNDVSVEQEEGSSGGSEVVDHKEQTANNALAMAKKALQSNTGGGYLVQSEDVNSELNKAYETYTGAGGTKSLEDFAKEALKGEKNEDIHQNDFKVIGQTNKTGNKWNWDDLAAGEDEEGGVTIEGVSNKKIRFLAQGANSEAASVATAQSVSNDSVFMYRNKAYVYHDGKAYSVTKMSKETNMWGMAPEKKLEAFNYQNLMKYKTGGLADFTGPAWLDGTKSKPEIILNQTDSANFILLKDILADVLKSTSSTSVNKIAQDKGGDNYYDIEINVDNISEDYDVEQLADKIKAMIYEDSIYRNVNAVNLIR